MKSLRKYIGFIALFLLGLAILLYPTFSNWWNERREARLAGDYEEAVAEVDTSEIEQIFKDAQAYNATLLGTIVPDAFADRKDKRDQTYESLLNPLGNGMMGSVEIPLINVDLPVYHYTSEEVLEKHAGHLPGSSLPIGGETTHCVISAHRGLPSAKLFTDLDRLKEGDVFYLHTLDETLAYEVDQIKVVEPTDTQDLSIVEGEDYCTLFTCTPYAVNSHRLLVRGHRIDYSEEQYHAESRRISIPPATLLAIRILCVFIGLALAALIIFLVRRRAKLRAGAE